MSQYFQLFNLPEQYPLDTAALEQRYRALAAQFHPDKHTTANPFEQKQALMMSATLNQAYATLKSPIDRAAQHPNRPRVSDAANAMARNPRPSPSRARPRRPARFAKRNHPSPNRALPTAGTRLRPARLSRRQRPSAPRTVFEQTATRNSECAGLNALYKISGCLNMIRQPENNNPVFRLPFPRINPIPTKSPSRAASKPTRR